MAAYDNVSLPGPPDIAHAGNYAQMLMQGLQAIPEKYYKAKDFQYQQQQRDLFQSPDSQAMLQRALDPNNTDPNKYAPVLQAIIKSQGASAGPVIGQLMSDEAGARLAKSISGDATPNSPVNTSSPNQTGAGLDKASQRLEGGAPTYPRIPYAGASEGSLSAGADNGQSVRTLTAGIGGPDRDVPGPVMDRLARSLGLPDADATIPEGQSDLARQRISAYLQRNGGVSQSPPSPTNDAASGGTPPINAASANQGNESPSVGAGGGQAISPAPTAAAGGIQPSGPQVAQAPARDTLTAADRGIRPTPVGTEAQAREAEIRAKNMRAMQAYYAGRNKNAAEAIGARAAEEEKRAHEIRDSIGKYNEPGTNPDVQGTLKTFEGAGTALGKRIGEVIEAGGKDARKTVNVLDIMEDALRRGGDHIFSGPGSDMALKVKQAAANLGLDVQGTTESETIQKLNAQLASAAAKALTARPSQLEFKAFMANNPGLMTSVKGSQMLIGILRQLTKQDIELSRKATNKANWNNWADVEDKFYSQSENQIKSPFTGKPLKGDDVVPGLGRAPSGGPPGLPNGVRSITVVQ